MVRLLVRSASVAVFASLIIGCATRLHAQDSTALVHIYRLGFSSKGGVPTYDLQKNGTATDVKVEPMSVNTLRCVPGVNQFSVSPKQSIQLELKPGRTYFIEFQSQWRHGFRHVSKAEALRDLSAINKFLAELVKDTDEETWVATQEENYAPVFTNNAAYQFRNVENDRIGFSQLSNDSLLITFEYFKKEPSGIYTRRLFLGDELYRLEVAGEKKNKYLEIKNADGTVIATSPISQTESNDIKMTDGTVYDWSELSNTSWWYTRRGEPVVRGYFERINNKRTIRVEWSQPVAVPLLFVFCMMQGVDVIFARDAKAKSILLPLIFGGLN